MAAREAVNDRKIEIEELLERFSLLRNHYLVDIERLMAIEESGSLFAHQKQSDCPLCGAPAEHGQHGAECEGNVEEIVLAASAEIEKIRNLTSDLDSTMSNLREEAIRVEKSIVEIGSQYDAIVSHLRESLKPAHTKSREVYNQLVDEKNAAKYLLKSFDRLERLQLQRASLVGDSSDDEDTLDTFRTEISKSVLNDFSQIVQAILQAWHFPEAGSVYFDESSHDFVIDGKPRGSRGKGYRAITHAAVTIGLMEYCQSKQLPHPGFVVVDSPLLSYFEPEGEEDDLRGTDLKQKFYEYLITNHADNQIVIIENQHPPEELIDSMSLTVFTKNPNDGRFGMFPPIGASTDLDLGN